MSKTPEESKVEMRELVMPHHANPQNTIFGGTIMSWIDICAAMAAQKHCNSNAVTVHVDEIDFLAPAKVGHHVIIKASVNYVGNTSLEIGVRVESENPINGESRLTTKAYLTFVCIDEFGHPKKAPALRPVTSEDKRRYENAKQRCLHRKELDTKLQKESKK